VDVIRGAAEAAARSVREDERVDIALAAYRLLDPRGRGRAFERAQLGYIFEDQDVFARVDTTSVVNKPISNLRRVYSPKTKGPKSSRRSAHGRTQAKEGEQERQNAVTDGSVDWGSGDLSVSERRGIVRELRAADEANLRGLSPLGWLRNQLGL
jgi:hypothetical protein